MRQQSWVLAITALFPALGACTEDAGPARITNVPAPTSFVASSNRLDAELRAYLVTLGYTGRVGSTLEARLGRRIDRQVAEVGRMLWFDPIGGLNDDNTCGGCHSPTNGFGDTQSIAIGIDNNGVVGPDRTGPRNQRRSPMVLNTAFYPTLMWNSRFRALSGDPFDNRSGLQFPAPEGLTLSYERHLLAAQAFIPPTERVEVAGFTFPGGNDDIRNEVLRRLNATRNYRELFSRAFPDVKAGSPITFDHVGRAIAEFEFTLVSADAPIDRYARGDRNAMSDQEKDGAVLFFGRAGCVGCHSVSGQSNEMFSDFREHVIAVPQVAPSVGNVTFDGPGHDEDFGLEQVTGNPADRYAFRTSPLRNVALQPAFMHNGAFVRLEDAIRHHLDPINSATSYSPAGLAADLRGPTGPATPVLQHLDSRLATAMSLSDGELSDLVAFVRNGLLDRSAEPQRLRRLIPDKLPSGRAPLRFEFR
ncbi:MAG TPA: cytochrome c peroxidase [Gemmatimonadaceae bacterium]|jgi:cytochrome c peroxidase|nr:cytochrome c peroxidase [Gemmatimonadaceae bacterium]